MFNDNYFKFVEDLQTITKINNITLTELAISWLLCYENITSVICGVRSVDQLKLNIKAINYLLSKKELKKIDESHEFFINRGNAT